MRDLRRNNLTRLLGGMILPTVLLLSGCNFGNNNMGPINPKHDDEDTPVVETEKPDDPADPSPIDLPKLDPSDPGIDPNKPGEDPNAPAIPVPNGILPGLPGADDPEYGSEVLVGGNTMQELIDSIKPNCELVFEDGKTCVSDYVEELIENDEYNHVYVYDMEGLIDAIAPNTTITIEAGEHNLSDYLNEIWNEYGESWNDTHEYVKLEEVFDGVQMSIEKVSNLTIKGVDPRKVEHNGEADSEIPGSNVETSIVIDPRYAAIFTFNYCSNITIADLKIGHTERGECVGNVCDFYMTRGIVFANTDIYGCGVYGIGMEYNSGDLCVFDSNIHDCSYGPILTYDAIGRNMLISSYLVDSNGFGAFWLGDEDSSLYLYKCKLGKYESDEYETNEAVTYECEWSEERPQYEY